MTSGAAALWARGQRGWPERFVLVQLPNAPLLVWLGARVAALPLEAGSDPARVLDGIARGGLAVWALLELTHGVNWFRRGLGAVALALVVIDLVA